MELAFDVATYRSRVASAREAMKEHDLDGLIATLPDAIFWFTGFDTIGYLWSQALLIDHTESEPKLFTRTTEGPGVNATTFLSDPVLYDIATTDPVQLIADAVKEAGMSPGRVGIDLSAFTLLPSNWERLKDALPEVEWLDTTEIVADLRLVKTPAELAYQQQAAEMADHAMRVAMDAVRPGISEVELAGIAAKALGEAGSEYVAIPPMVVSGERSAMVHGMASRRTISRGDVVCIELGASVHRYHAIVMRTAVVGTPTERVREVADCLREAYDAAVDAVGPGVKPEAPDDAANEVLSRLDLVRRRCHRIGYSLGIAYPPGWLEPMTLVAGDKRTLAPGMSFSIEPNLTLQDEGFGMKLGDTVRCTDEGGERLSAIDPELVEAI